MLSDGGLPKKRKVTAEGRSRPRRCPGCGAVVPAGMSLCRCGLDLDTGKRAQVLDEILEEAPPPPSGPSLPLSVVVPGVLILLISGVLTITALVKSVETGGPAIGPISQQQGFLSLALIGGFSIYAATQFVRLRSIKMVIVALLLGALIDLVGLIVMPIVDAVNLDQAKMEAPIDIDTPGQIQSAVETLNLRKLYCGIAILLADAGLVIYLLTPVVRGHFERNREGPMVPIG